MACFFLHSTSVSFPANVCSSTGAVSSIGMEVIQQAPFLPLTMSLMETIASLNGSQLAATQQSIAEHLAKTYQYVHVPKLNVIHDCLGILIKERKIYHTGNGYFVSSHSPFDKPADAPKENGDAPKAEESRCVACEVISKGKSAKAEKAKKKKKEREKQGSKDKENGKVKNSAKEEEVPDCKTPVGQVESKREERGTQDKPPTPETREETTKSPSETASETSSEGATKKAKKQKKGVLNQISCFIKGKTLSTAEVSEDTKKETEPETIQKQTVPSPSLPPQVAHAQCPAPLAVQEDKSLSLSRKERSIRLQFRNKRALSAPAENPSLFTPVLNKELEKPVKREAKKTVPKPRELVRSKSFAAAEKRPAPVKRSNSFSAASTRVARQISTESAPGTWDRRLRMNYGDIIRNTPARQTIHISRPSSCNIGIVRPLDSTKQRPFSRSNSLKKETPRKKGGSLSPPGTPRSFATPNSTPRLKENSNRQVVVRSKSFTEPGIMRLPNGPFSFRPTMGPHYESPLQQLLARKTSGYTVPPSTGVRVTVAPKGRYYTPVKRSPASPKRTPPNSPSRKQLKQPAGLSLKEKTYNRNDCTAPVCYDRSMINDRVTNCMYNGDVNHAEGTAIFQSVLHPNHNYPQHVVSPSDGVSSEHICIEDMTSTSASEVTLTEDVDRYAETRTDNEGKPLGLYKTFNDEGVNDSLTFIGII